MPVYKRTAIRASLTTLTAALLAAYVFATEAHAQSLMVGADGAIHLDPSLEASANSPVIIQQTPELIAPGASFAGPPIPLHQQLDAQPLSNALAAPAYDACPPFVPYMPMVAQSIQQQPLPIKYSFFGEFLFLHPTGTDIVHAQQQDGVGGAGTVPFGETIANDFHYEPGVRIGGDMAVGPTSSIAASYTYFESNAQSTAPPPAGATLPAVGSLVHVPGAAVQGTPGTLQSRSVLDFQLANAEYRTRLHQGPRSWLSGGLGLQYAHLEQEFGQTGPFLFPAGTLVTQSNVEFDGGGPRLSLDGGRNIGNRGFSIYARSSVSPMAGQFHADYSLRNATTVDQLALARWKDDRVMTVFDYELGLAWTGPRRRWRFSAGYLQSHWFNAATPNEFIPAVQSSDYHDVSETITFDGLTARVEHLW
ncbi:MAG TPA: Lpg1974 family pore-forming outer membrane protein, partial [Lacipirellula sp.]